MKEVLDLNEYLKENIKEILKCKEENSDFDYDDRFVEGIYKLSWTFVKKYKVNEEDKEDFVQECVHKFFSHIIYKWDYSKNNSITTYAFASFFNMYLVYINDKQRKFEQEKVSLDKKITREDTYFEDSCELVDFIESGELNTLDEYIKEEKNKFLRDKLLNDEILYKYFYERKTLREIGEEIGYSRTTVSNKIEDKLRKIKEEYNLKLGGLKDKNKR